MWGRSFWVRQQMCRVRQFLPPCLCRNRKRDKISHFFEVLEFGSKYFRVYLGERISKMYQRMPLRLGSRFHIVSIFLLWNYFKPNMIQGSHCVNVPGLNSAPEAAECEFIHSFIVKFSTFILHNILALMRIKEWGLQSMSDQVLGQLRFHKSFSITFDFRPSRISDKGLRFMSQRLSKT